MTTRTSRTISVLEGDWERWKEAAWQRRIPSVSEFIRKAVEAYEHGPTVVAHPGGVEGGISGCPTAKTQTQPLPVVGAGHSHDIDGNPSLLDAEQVDTTPAGWTRLPLSVQTTETDAPHALETSSQEVQAEKSPRRPVVEVEAPADESGARHPLEAEIDRTARFAEDIIVAAARARPYEGCEPDGTFILRHRAGGAQIISPEEAKERVEAVARDTAGLILPVGYTGADASELIFGPTERMTPTPPRDLALPPLAPHIAAEHERVADARRRQPVTKESQLKRRGKG